MDDDIAPTWSFDDELLDEIQDVASDVSSFESRIRSEFICYVIRPLTPPIAYIDFLRGSQDLRQWSTVSVLPVVGLQRPLLLQARDRQASGTRLRDSFYNEAHHLRREYGHRHKKPHFLEHHLSRIGWDDQDSDPVACTHCRDDPDPGRNKMNWKVRLFLPASYLRGKPGKLTCLVPVRS